jgi:chromosome segregation protein
MMSVEDTWQSACEFVMGITLQAVVVDTLESLWPEWPSLVKSACMITTNKQARLNKGSYPRLSDKIQGIVPSFVLDLDKIYTASSVDEARDWLPFIQEDESIITPDCCWFSKGWVRTPGVSTQEHQSLLAKQQELKRISQSLISVEDELSHLKLKRDELREMLQANSHQVSSTQQQLADWREKIRNCEAEIRNQERIAQQHLNNKGRLSEEYDTLHSRLEDLVTQQANVENKAQEAVELRQQYEEKKQQILIEKSTLENTLSEQRQTLDEARTAAHQLALEREREQLIVSQLTKNITRDQDRLDGVSERMEAVAEQLLAVETPDVSLGDSLNEKLSRHAEMEEHLNASREQLASLLQEIETQEARIREEEKQAKAIQDRIQQQQLQRQTVLVHADNLVEGLHELGAQPDSLLRVMPSGTTTALREQDLQSLVDRIKRLGAINLAAIEEYETEKQRKQYLDEQYQDLTEALQTLDAAIEKMDKETTQRLQQTFDEVNRAFQSLFPRLFGGGRAMLELTCDNLLEAGVIVMAQPPGKRNSTIHLLSGGEKAMTAVALVFAIFQLNPSPFCMLDEVDAPLDDVNVGRFCTLVKEMSQFVQFLFITHNKITMELADHLIGVTMREPGVSRVVSVDVEQALAMTEL